MNITSATPCPVQASDQQHKAIEPLVATRHAAKVTPTLAAILRARLLCDRLVTLCRNGESSNATIARELMEQIDVTLAFYRGETSEQTEVVIDLNPNYIRRELSSCPS